MQQAHIDSLLLALGFCGEAFLAGLLVRRRLYRSFPLFTAYVFYSALTDAAGSLVLHYGSQALYFYWYCGATTLEYALQLFVLYEIARAVLTPVRRALPRSTLKILIGAVCLSAAAGVLAAPHLKNKAIENVWLFTMGFTLLLVVLRLAVFLLVSGFSQMLGIGWKNYVLQLASGFAFYGIITVAIQAAIRHVSHTVGSNIYVSQVSTLNEIQALAYIGTLAFWIWAFSQNEAPRKEFTPQMQAVLVTIAGSARRTRSAVTQSQRQK